MDAAITNVTELQNEIIRLRIKKAEQETTLKQHFNSPKAIMHTAMSLFPKSADGKESLLGKNASQDIIGWISKIVIPFALNKTLFRKSNFIVKFLVGLASQRASKFVNEKSVISVWDKIKAAIPKPLMDKLETLTHKKAKVVETRGSLLTKRIANT
jgi:hypothetical protein